MTKPKRKPLGREAWKWWVLYFLTCYRLTYLQKNPSEWAAQLLLGLESINASKSDHSSEATRVHLFTTGTKYIEKAFQQSTRNNAAAANALCEFFLQKGDVTRVCR